MKTCGELIQEALNRLAGHYAEMGYTVTEIGVAIKGHETVYHVMAEGAPHEGKAGGEVSDA